MTPEEKAALKDKFLRLALADIDDDADAYGLRIFLVWLLNDGKAGPEVQKWIAQLLSPDQSTFYRLDVVQRTRGNPQDRRDANETKFRLLDIWLAVENKSSFVRIAEQKTGLSQKTIRKHLKKLREIEKAMAEEIKDRTLLGEWPT